MRATSLISWDDLEINSPAGALVGNVDLVIVRYGDDTTSTRSSTGDACTGARCSPTVRLSART